jgi:phenylacetate-CoA ligase
VSGGGFLDARETRDPRERERDLFARLPAQVEHAMRSTRYYGRLLASVDPRAIADRAALATLPLTRKSQLAELQRASLPFGGLAAAAPGRLARIFMSPGPIYDPEGRGPDYWRTARALHAAGFREGDLALNCYAYHLSPAASMFETGLHRLGCTVIPGGTGNTEQQARAVGDLRPAGYVGTPSFVKILLEKCDELAIDSSSIRRASVSGEALMPVVRDFLRARGVEAYQAYGTADLGLIAYETPAREGLVVEEDVIVEIVRPGTGDPVAPGEVGEVVVTTFSAEYPLVRLATGDLSAAMEGPSPCGRTNMRIRGWMGRADQSAKVRGLFVHPHQVAEVLKRHGAARGRLVIENEEGEDRMTFQVEGPVDAAAMEASLRDVMKVRGQVVSVDAAALPNDGRVIEDRRRNA